MSVLPVIGSQNLRSNPRNRHFARNRESEFTGKSQKSPFCP
ncbi:MAG: vitamin B12-binding protein [Ligilactobacillus ruminis]|nr:vitamin B12-binding protein [Ligilactobacillus ruminis]